MTTQRSFLGATRGRFRLFAWLTALAIGGAAAPGACTLDRDDRFVLLRRDRERAPGAPTPLTFAATDDAGAVRVRRLMSDELAGELLRTLAMIRRLVSGTAPPLSVRRARASSPAYLVLGVSDLDRGRPYRDRSIAGGWWREPIAADVPLVWIDERADELEIGQTLESAASLAGARATDESLRDAVVFDQIVTGLGHAILSLVAPGPAIPEGDAAARAPLDQGYVQFLEVVATEWHSASGDVAADDARALLRRADWFAAVRGNQGVARFQKPRSSVLQLVINEGEAVPAQTDDALVRDPTVIATVLYRLAASEVGRRLAPDETYRGMVPELPPAGVSPGRLLGAFRNFQAKLLWAWNRAELAGRPPRDLVDLVDAYADAYPAERADVTRIFLVTTNGLTVRPGGIDPLLPPGHVAADLAALTADVLFGRLDLRAGLQPASPTPAGAGLRVD